MKTPKHRDEPFSVVKFTATNVMTFVAFMGAFKLLFPALFAAELNHAWWVLFGTFLLCQAREALTEWAFHRWFLHAPLVPGMTGLWKAHTLHHNRTLFLMHHVTDGQGKVTNKYPILEERQNVSSFFPSWSLAAFTCFALVTTVVPLKLLFPSMPIVSMTIVSVTWSMFFYEIVHSIEHRPFESFWLPKIDGRLGWFWRRAYFFHLWHHREIKVNECISGFVLGIPLADWLMRTYVACRFERIPQHGEVMAEKAFEHPAPETWSFVRHLDRLAEKRAERILKTLGPNALA
jgi:hemolysin III